MLTGGEKAKVKNIVMAIKGEYPTILDVLDNEKFLKDQKCIDTLFDCTKKIFMWLAHLSTTTINTNEVLNTGFDLLQEVHRVSTISHKDSRKVETLMKSVEMIPDIQQELIKLVTSDTDLRERVLKDIMDELGIENPNKKKKTDKKFSSMSFDDWFNDD